MAIENVCPEKYHMDPREVVIAAAMKCFLSNLSEKKQKLRMAEILAPAIVQLGEFGTGKRHAYPLQSTIDGKCLATLIDDAIAFVLTDHRTEYRGNVEAVKGLEVFLKSCTGSACVSNSSYEFYQFIGDCYAAVKYDKGL